MLLLSVISEAQYYKALKTIRKNNKHNENAGGKYHGNVAKCIRKNKCTVI